MDEKTYNIVIKNETEKQGTPVATKSGKSTKAGKPAEEKVDGNNLEGAVIAYQTIKPYVNQVATATIGNIGLGTGAVELQQRASVYASMSGTAVALGTMVATGNYVGVALMGVSEMIQIAVRKVQLDMQKKLEDEQISLRSSRLGMATDRSRWA